MVKDVIEVKAVNGDTHLGGVDFNNRMVSHFAAEFERKHHKDISNNPRALSRLKTACERAKRMLSSASETFINIESLFDGTDFSSTITRARFEKMNLDLFEDCMASVEKCLKDAKMDKVDIHDIVLVGGSTRIPKVQELLQDLFHGKQLCKNISPDEAVAYGAAFHAAALTNACLGKNKDTVLVDVCPLSLGIEVYDGGMLVVIPRNTTIPTKMTRNDLTFVVDYQTRCTIQVYEGEMPIAKDNNFLGEFSIEGIPPAPAGVAKFIDSFEIDANGILTVTTELVGSNNSNQITITNHSGRLSKEEIDRMVKEAEDYRAQDEERKKAIEAKNALESYIHQARRCGRRVQTKAARIKLKNTIETTVQWLEWNDLLRDAGKFEEKMKELKSMCESVMAETHHQGSDTAVKHEIIEISD
ncbi:unnamed protein product [Cuscuta epithymum]|uniref:Heat shock protein 70 n=1 Tax=Cuscuta epithymum TaxID=186058 RepID=A0AAV0DVH1_9ASTE|nr:unnamed protein product [Cuscuta epithymum]